MPPNNPSGLIVSPWFMFHDAWFGKLVFVLVFPNCRVTPPVVMLWAWGTVWWVHILARIRLNLWTKYGSHQQQVFVDTGAGIPVYSILLVYSTLIPKRSCSRWAAGTSMEGATHWPLSADFHLFVAMVTAGYTGIYPAVIGWEAGIQAGKKSLVHHRHHTHSLKHTKTAHTLYFSKRVNVGTMRQRSSPFIYYVNCWLASTTNENEATRLLYVPNVSCA